MKTILIIGAVVLVALIGVVIFAAGLTVAAVNAILKEFMDD